MKIELSLTTDDCLALLDSLEDATLYAEKRAVEFYEPSFMTDKSNHWKQRARRLSELRRRVQIGILVASNEEKEEERNGN